MLQKLSDAMSLTGKTVIFNSSLYICVRYSRNYSYSTLFLHPHDTHNNGVASTLFICISKCKFEKSHIQRPIQDKSWQRIQGGVMYSIWSRVSWKKPLSMIYADEGSDAPHLEKTLGCFDLLMIGIGGTVGSGVFATAGMVLRYKMRTPLYIYIYCVCVDDTHLCSRLQNRMQGQGQS
jgi:hypothetical protein